MAGVEGAGASRALGELASTGLAADGGVSMASVSRGEAAGGAFAALALEPLEANQWDMRLIRGDAANEASTGTRGEYLEWEWWLPPSKTPPKHIHPSSERTTRCSRVPSRSSCAMAGARWPPGSRPRRPSARCIRSESATGPCAFGTCIAPAFDFEDYFAAESALMEAGRIRSYSSARAVLHYAALLDQYRDCMVIASPLLRGLITALAPLGRRLGFGRP